MDRARPDHMALRRSGREEGRSAAVQATTVLPPCYHLVTLLPGAVAVAGGAGWRRLCPAARRHAGSTHVCVGGVGVLDKHTAHEASLMPPLLESSSVSLA